MEQPATCGELILILGQFHVVESESFDSRLTHLSDSGWPFGRTGCNFKNIERTFPDVDKRPRYYHPANRRPCSPPTTSYGFHRSPTVRNHWRNRSSTRANASLPSRQGNELSARRNKYVTPPPSPSLFRNFMVEMI